ncbi:MAG TPA: hypothetical protein PKM73_09495 [Verrucomicrobiota bacterium]|nr:hypothetical protein [Verrucomicrobiota bacterium]HNU52009.1 hypothetical protein [Verrucomicrobiota bacterium]
MYKYCVVTLAFVGVIHGASIRVSFVSDPTGAIVTVTEQGRVLFSGPTPITKQVLKPKTSAVTVEVSKQGYLPQQRFLTRQDHDTTILFQLQSAEKKIGVYSSVAATQVLVDDEPRGECGPASPLVLSLPVMDTQQAGRVYTVAARKTGWKPAEARLSMSESSVPPEVRFRLEPERKTLHITSDPAGASVFVDGESRKEKTPCDITIAFVRVDESELRSVKVEIELDGYEMPPNHTRRPAKIVEHFTQEKSSIDFKLQKAEDADVPGIEVIVLPTGAALGVRKTRAMLNPAEDSPTVASCTQMTENRPIDLEEFASTMGVPATQLRDLILRLDWDDIEKTIPPTATEVLKELLQKYLGAITSLTMSPDGKYLVYSELEPVFQRFDDVGTRKPASRFWGPVAGKHRFEGECAIPCNTARLSFSLKGTLKAIAVPGKGTTTITDSAFIDKDPSFTRDGKYVYFASNRDGEKFSLWRVRFEPPTGTGITRITTSMYADHEICVCRAEGQQRLVFARLSPNAKPHEQQIWISELDGTLPTQFRYGFNPFWTPDGAMIAFARIDGKTGWNKVWVMRGDGAEQTQMTTGDFDDVRPAWSPDGMHVAYASSFGLDRNRNHNYDIWVMKSDGTKATQLTTNGSEDTCPTWSPDGRHIYFVSNRGGAWNIWRLETKELP